MPSKVLILRLSAFGDVAMLVPVVYSVASQYPQVHFFVMTRKAFAPLFENLGFNINVVPLDLKGRHSGILGFWRILRKVIFRGFAVADEHDVLRTKILRWILLLAGHKVRHIDKGRKEKEDLIHTKRIYPPLKHTIQRYMDVFDKLGFPANLSFQNILLFAPYSIDNIKAVTGEKVGKWIGIAPFAKHKGKIFPLEKMELVIESLSKKTESRIFLFGTEKERINTVKQWCEKYPNVEDISGKLNLSKELILMSHLDVMISMDSANMHLASLVQTPVVSIWGATHPSLGFYGYDQNPENAIGTDIECRPCSVFGDIPCKRGDYACLYGIDESLIIDKVEKILSENKK